MLDKLQTFQTTHTNFPIVPEESQKLFKSAAFDILTASGEVIFYLYDKDNPNYSPMLILSNLKKMLRGIVVANFVLGVDTTAEYKALDAENEPPTLKAALAKIAAFSANIFSIRHFYDDEDSANLLSHDLNRLLYFFSILIKRENISLDQVLTYGDEDDN